MNTLFIYSLYDICSPKKPLSRLDQMAYGISYISALLKKHGHETRLFISSSSYPNIPYRLIDETITSFRPELICFGAVCSEYQHVRKIAQYIKHRHPRIYLIAGGVHVSLNPEEVIKDEFDAICIGEGEFATLELAQQLEKGLLPARIENLWFKRGAVVEKNPLRPFLNNLDILPFPDRQMWRPWVENAEQQSYTSILLGRGCPFECSYCCNHALRYLTTGSYVRLRSVEYVVEEISAIIKDSPHIKSFGLEIDTIGVKNAWVFELCDKLEALNRNLPVPLSFGTNLRITPQADFTELFAAFKKSNFTFINIGLESGSERVRREILRRFYSNEDIRRAVETGRLFGLRIIFYIMFGIPGETKNDFHETVELTRTCAPDGCYGSIFYPYPGTAIYAVCKSKGWLDHYNDTSGERQDAKFDTPYFTRSQIKRNFIWFNYLVADNNGNRAQLFLAALLSEFISVFKSVPGFNKFYTHLLYRSFVRKVRRFLVKNRKDQLKR